MKQLESSMASDVPVLSSVQAWLGHELDSRGIDASVYARYIVSLLQHEDLEGEHQEGIPLSGLRKTASGLGPVTSRARSKPKKVEKKKAEDLSLDELRKMAAIDCLLSASEESSDIESLVEELYIKLKALQEDADVSNGSPKRVLQEIQLQSGDSGNTEDPKQKYYAAFPALSDKFTWTYPQNNKTTDGKVWAEVAGRQTEDSGSAEASEECNNNIVRRVRKTPRSPAKEEKERQNFESKYRESEGRKGSCKGLFMSPVNRTGYGYSCSPGSTGRHSHKKSPSSSHSSKHNSPSNRYYGHRSRNIDPTKGRALFQQSATTADVMKSRCSYPGIVPPAFIVPKVSPNKPGKTSSGSFSRCRSEEKAVERSRATLLFRCLSESVERDELAISRGEEEEAEDPMLGELQLLVEDLMWYTQPLDTIILPSPVPKQRLYQRNQADERQEKEAASKTEATAGFAPCKKGHCDVEAPVDENIIEFNVEGDETYEEIVTDFTEPGMGYESFSPMEEFEDGEFCLEKEGLEKSRYLEVIKACQREDVMRCDEGSKEVVDEVILSCISSNLCSDEISPDVPGPPQHEELRKDEPFSSNADLCVAQRKEKQPWSQSSELFADEVKETKPWSENTESSMQPATEKQPWGQNVQSSVQVDETQLWTPSVDSGIIEIDGKQSLNLESSGQNTGEKLGLVPDLQFLDNHFEEVSRENSYGNLQETFNLGFGYVPPNTPVHHKDMPYRDDALGLSNLVQLAEHMKNLSQESEHEFEIWSRKASLDNEGGSHCEAVSQEEICVQCEVTAKPEEGKESNCLAKCFMLLGPDKDTEDLEKPFGSPSSSECGCATMGTFPLLYEDLQSERTGIPTPLSTCSGEAHHTEDSYIFSSSDEEENNQNQIEQLEFHDYNDSAEIDGNRVRDVDGEKMTSKANTQDALSKYAVGLGHLDILKQLDLDSSGDSEALFASLQESEADEAVDQGVNELERHAHQGDDSHSFCEPPCTSSSSSSLWWDIPGNSTTATSWSCCGAGAVASIWGIGIGGLSWGVADLPCCDCATGYSLSTWNSGGGSNRVYDLASLWNTCSDSVQAFRPSPLREFFSPKVQHGQESRIWDINIQRRLDFAGSPLLEHSRALFSPVYFSQVNLSRIHMTFIKGGLYGNEWDRILDIGTNAGSPGTPPTGESPVPFKQMSSAMFQLRSRSEKGMLSWLQDDLCDRGQHTHNSIDLHPSENSAFTGVSRHAAENVGNGHAAFTCTPLHHVQSEPIFSQGGAAVGRHCVDCQYRMIQVKHLYKSDTSILRQLGLATGTDAEETYQQDSIEYSPDRHFVPIHTAQECVPNSPATAAMLNGEENPLSQDLPKMGGDNAMQTPRMKCSSSYQLYLDEEEDISDVCFVPSFRVQKNHEKCAQTGEESPPEVLEASMSSSVADDEEQEKALAERLLTDVGHVLDMEMCREELTVKDLDSSLLMQETNSSDYESMVQDTSVEDYQSNVDVAHLWNDASTPTASVGVHHTIPNFWEDSMPMASVHSVVASTNVLDDTAGFGISHLWQESSPTEENKSADHRSNDTRFRHSIWSLGSDSQMLSLPLEIQGPNRTQSICEEHAFEHSPNHPVGGLAQSVETLTGQSDTKTVTEEQGDILLDAFAASIDNFEDYIYQDYKHTNSEGDVGVNYSNVDPEWSAQKLLEMEPQQKWSTGEFNSRWKSSHEPLWQYEGDSGQESTFPEWMMHNVCSEEPSTLSVGGCNHPVEREALEPEWMARLPHENECWDSENDMVFVLDSPMVPADGCVFSADLETQWLANRTAFSVQVPRKQKIKHKQGVGERKPCSFFMEGSCRRTDCKFAHDMSHITCRFWEEGECFKGVTCPFLHGYTTHSAPVHHRRPRRKRKDEFQLEKHDFPSLTREQNNSSSMSAASSGSEMKRSCPSQDSTDSDPSITKETKQDRSCSIEKEKSTSLHTKQTGRKKKERSKVKARSLPIDINFKKKV